MEIGELGGMVAVRCPHDLDPIMRRAGGTWEPGTRRWLIEQRRIGPVLRHLLRTTEPLFRQAGLKLDEREPDRTAKKPRGSQGAWVDDGAETPESVKAFLARMIRTQLRVVVLPCIILAALRDDDDRRK